MPENIKLRVCDVDGTLLQKNETELSTAAVAAINELESCGIVFVAASGRSIPSLEKIFEKVKRKAFIGCDGAVIKGTCGRILYEKAIPSESLNRILPKLKCEFVLYTQDVAYVRGDALYENVCAAENGKVKSFDEFSTDVPVLKIALYGGGDEYGARYIEANNLGRRCYSDANWCEYVAPCVNKGEALKFIQSSFNFKYEETVAHGDNHKDIEILKNAYFSYAVSGSQPEIKTLARFYTESAAEQIKKIAKKCERR